MQVDRLKDVNDSELGKKSTYISEYDASLLFPIQRQLKRDELGIQDEVSAKKYFQGFDLWTGYELSWLNLKGKPEVRIVKFRFDAHTRNLIESKSFKLYLNSFNNTKFENDHVVITVLQRDLSIAAQGSVSVEIFTLAHFPDLIDTHVEPCIFLDTLDIEVDQYVTDDRFLQLVSDDVVEERLGSDLLKSNCLVTGQPDWGSIYIHYKGKQIDHEGLLRYIISFRNHNEFHEQCIERIYSDLMTRCQPSLLTVYARYTRRGGLDINPLRTNTSTALPFELSQKRMVRQ